MAREAGLMGVPCIYTGGRSMSVNEALIQKGIMFKLDTPDEILNRIDLLFLNEKHEQMRSDMNRFVINTYDDLNQVFINQILMLNKK